MRPNGILIIAALLLGVAGGYLLRGETGPHSPPPADTPYREHEPTVPTAEPEMLAQDPAPAPTQPTLESVHGDGVIRGRIADKSGAGVPGVAVVATPLVRGRAGAPNPTRAAPARTSLEADLADAAESVRARHAGRQRVLSDEFGAYIVKHLGPGAYRIVAWKEHYQIRPARGSPAWEAKAGVVVDFEADAILVAYLDVTGADGRTPERANISSSTDAEGHKGRRRFLWTPEQNWVQLSPGEHWLVADAHDGEEESAPAHVTLLPGEPAPRATLELIGRPGIRGRVILPEPLEMFHPEVAAIRFEGETPPDANEAMQSRGRNSGNFDRRDNTYSLKEMEAGRYLLMVSFDGRSVEHSVVVDVGNSVLVQDLELPPIDRTRYRVVRVLGENGMAISGVQFSLSVRSKGGGLSAGASTVQRADGSYYVSRRPSISDESHREMIEASDAITHLRVLVRDRGSIVRQV
ncbi:MAG: hypothetical protein GY946_04890, partial [bacterium]|nr:hypothetical protein [bacterium]